MTDFENWPSPDAWTNSPFRYVIPSGQDLQQSLDRGDGFDLQAAYRHPGSLARFDRPGDRKRVCVIGGGVAGLVAALELAKLGHHVSLFEASNRFGGRIWTHYFADGNYGELGAMRIPQNHGCVWYYIDELGLRQRMRKFLGENPNGWCLFRGQGRMRRHEWERTGGTFYQLDPGERGLSSELLIQDLAAVAGTLTFSDWWGALSNRIVAPRIAALEALTLWQHVKGAASPSSAFPAELLSDEGWEFAGRTRHHLWLERCSLLHWLREAAILDQGDKYEIDGGMQLLTRAFEKAVRDRSANALRLRVRVEAIDELENSVRVVWTSAGSSRCIDEEFQYVICTAPAPATSRIQFSPPIPPRKREALTNLSYIGAGKTLMHCSKRHWEIHDGIFGGSSVTDLPNQQCWYPSDNVRGKTDEESDHLTEQLILDPMVDKLEAPVAPTDFTPISEERSQAPGVFLAAYVWGTNARRFASLSDDERDDLVIRAVAELHPPNIDYLDEIVHVAWDQEFGPGGGAFAFFAPGEQRRYQAQLCAPLWKVESPRVFFAGEHVGVVQGWIQGAIQSALSATIDVLKA